MGQQYLPCDIGKMVCNRSSNGAIFAWEHGENCLSKEVEDYQHSLIYLHYIYGVHERKYIYFNVSLNDSFSNVKCVSINLLFFHFVETQ